MNLFRSVQKIWVKPHLIKLAFLAPDIITAINKGDIPPALTLERLKRTIPLDWEDQRQTFGFARQAATPN